MSRIKQITSGVDKLHLIQTCNSGQRTPECSSTFFSYFIGLKNWVYDLSCLSFYYGSTVSSDFFLLVRL